MLAGGATVEELAAETDMELGTIDMFTGQDSGIAAYADFRAAASVAAQGDFPEILTLDDGGVFALRLDETVAPALRPFEEVEEQAATALAQDNLTAAITARAEEIVAALNSGALVEETGLSLASETGLTREAFIEGAPAGFIEMVFDLEVGTAGYTSAGGTVALAIVNATAGPNYDDPEIVALVDALNAEVAAGIEQEIFQTFATGLQGAGGVAVEQSVINAVHAQFP